MCRALQEDEEVPTGHPTVEIHSVSQDPLGAQVGATLPAHQSPVSVPAPGKLLSVSCASLWALRSNLDKALPDWALGCDTPDARWGLKGWGAAEKSQRVVSGTDAVGHLEGLDSSYSSASDLLVAWTSCLPSLGLLFFICKMDLTILSFLGNVGKPE